MNENNNASGSPQEQGFQMEPAKQEEDLEVIASQEFETEYVKKMVANKQKRLFENVKKTAAYPTLVQNLANSYDRSSRSIEEAIRKVEENEKKITELFEGRNTLWDTIRLYWNKLTKAEYTEKEFYIDKLIRNSKDSVAELDSKLQQFRTVKEQLETYYNEKQQLKLELNETIDDYKAALVKIDAEIEKYKRDYNRLEKQGEYGLRDTLEIEINKMVRDRKTLDTQLKIAARKLEFVDNTANVIDALYEQANNTLTTVEIFRSSVDDYIREAEQMKDVIVKLSSIIRVTGAVQKYAAKIQNAMNKGLDLLSQNLEIIMKSISATPSEFYSEATSAGLERRGRESYDILRESTEDTESRIENIRKKPGKYSADKEN